MKILQITPLFSPHLGGIERHVETLSYKLIERGHNVVLYTANIPRTIDYEIKDGLEIYRFNSQFSILNNPFTLGLLSKMIKSTDFNLIHVHSHLHFSSNLAVLSQIGRKKPIILTSHGIVSYTGNESWKNMIGKIYDISIARIMLNSVDKIIALSPQHANIIKKLGGSTNNICVIPNWVELSKMRDNSIIEKHNKYDGSNDKVFILYVGAIIPRKGIKHLIDSMKYVSDNAILLIVGDELPGYKGIKQKFKQQIKEMGLNNIYFLGRLSNEDLSNAYSKADIFVLPSISEGLPLVLLEAMAYKKCIVATDIAGISDVIQNNKNGLLCEPKNPRDLANKLNYVISNSSLRDELGKKARSELEANYECNKVIDRIEELYLSLSK